MTQTRRLSRDNEDLNSRFKNHSATASQQEGMYNVRWNASELAYFIDERVPAGREKSLALTHLEEVVFWANAGIARAKSEEGLEHA